MYVLYIFIFGIISAHLTRLQNLTSASKKLSDTVNFYKFIKIKISAISDGVGTEKMKKKFLRLLLVDFENFYSSFIISEVLQNFHLTKIWNL